MRKNIFLSGNLLLLCALLNAIVLEHGFAENDRWYGALAVTFPLLIAAAIRHKRKKKDLQQILT